MAWHTNAVHVLYSSGFKKINCKFYFVLFVLFFLFLLDIVKLYI